MPRIGLALSGGGFRATLYHLGVVRYLKDVGQLQHVTDIASVSGGSILAAHLVLNWDRYLGDDERFDEVAGEIVRFVQFDVRNHIIRRMPLQYALRFVAKLLPLDRDRLTPNATLERYYQTLLYGDRRLYELPEQPALHVLTTNVSTGALSVFNREGLYIQQRGDSIVAPFEHVPGQMASIAKVVGASSAFPGLFPPVQISAADLGVREGQFASEWFTDGGVYDNLGIRAFSWLIREERVFDQILVSDAGKPFQILSDASLGFVGQSVRATDILWDRVWQLERENFGKQDGFAFLPITDDVSPSEDPTALHSVVQAEVQSIRTDLDRFSDLEINALAQHGYEVARKTCRQIGIDNTESIQVPPWAPISEKSVAIQSTRAPRSHEPSEPTQVSLQLRKSSRRRTWSTLLSLRDWPSYIYIALALLLIVFMPWQVYKLYHHAQVQATVIDAIADGDPDVRQILDLVNADPTEGWVGDIIQEKPELTQLDYTGVEITAHSRIIDLRRWRPHETTPERRGRIYVRDRRTLMFDESYTGNRRVIFRSQFPLADAECRQLGSFEQGVISKISRPLPQEDDQRDVYEIEYDLSMVSVGEPVTLVVETLATFPELITSRAPFITEAKTNLFSVWILFPEDRPYRTYDLVHYPIDRSTPPEIMNVQYTIDHPYGSLIGWSINNPIIDRVYECRWSE